jgi:prevent-host-death family protein
MNIAAGEFKAKCLKLIDRVNETREVLVITKHGVPKAQLIPFCKKRKKLFGFMKGSASVTGDILSPIK